MATAVTRRFVLWAGMFGIALAGPVSGHLGKAGSNPANSVATRLADLFGDVASARQIGQAYLEQHPADADRQRLVTEFADLIVSRARAQKFEVACREDFATGNTVLVRGWLLSRTEARLCGLAALA